MTEDSAKCFLQICEETTISFLRNSQNCPIISKHLTTLQPLTINKNATANCSKSIWSMAAYGPKLIVHLYYIL